MKYLPLPRTDLTVSQLCFGCWGLISDGHWGDRDRKHSVDAIHAALEAGVNFFDTATVYGDGKSETLLGEVLAANGSRQKIVIASKPPPNRMRPDEIQAECEASLTRLQTDYLDLYQTHWTSRDVPLADCWGAMQRLVEQGKVRHIGVCNMGVGDIKDVCNLEPPATNQLPYNLLWRGLEWDILPTCIDNDLGVLVYSPLMHGILADKYATADDVPEGRARTRHFSSSRAQTRHSESGCEQETFATLDAIRAHCDELGRRMSDVALAWLAHRPGIVSVIAGASNADQLQQNTDAVDQPLSAESISVLDKATDALKQTLGANPDMWDGGADSRYR